ncbi:MAG: hypothetical protein QW561_00455 [Candidatus Aenigmatarchaeota archaeon]
MREVVAYAIVGIICLVAGYFLNPVITGKIISNDKIGYDVVDFVNKYLLSEGEAHLINVSSPVSLYNVYISIQTNAGNQIIPVWVTDSGMLFAGGMNMSEYAKIYESISGSTQTGSFDAPDREKPTVELFVMSFCPYGIQAETLMKPVVELLKDKAEFIVRYIVNINSDGSISSLHGQYEVNEDLRQVCIQNKYPEKFWSYIEQFNAQCGQYAGKDPEVKNCSISIMQNLSLNVDGIITCAEGNESKILIGIDNDISSAYGVRGSPTLIINGKEYSGSRSSEAYKNAVCSGFVNPPAECNQTLSSSSGSTPSGGCGG